MSLRIKFALALAGLSVYVVAGVALLLFGVWSSVEARDQDVVSRVLSDQATLVASGTVLILLGLAAIVALFFKLYVAAPRRLAAETRLIATANPGHRLAAGGPAELARVAAAVNELANQLQTAQADVEGKIAAARVEVEEERNRLATLMSELTLAVLVCNVDGRILLYNAAAKELLGENLVGLGRSIFGILDRSLIAHALEQVRDGASSHVAAAARENQLVRAQVAPVRSDGDELTGFVLTIDDMTRRAAVSGRRDALLQSLTEGTRSSLGTVRAAVESMLEYPEMDVAQRDRFMAVIRDEAIGLTEQVERAVEESAEFLKGQWSLADMSGRDLVSTLQRSLDGELDVSTSASEAADDLWLKVDSFAVVRAVTFLAERLHNELGVDRFSLALADAGRFCELDLAWEGATLDGETLKAWTSRPLLRAGGGIPSTVAEVVERHGGEVWCQADEDSDRSWVRLMLPRAAAESDGTSEPRRSSRAVSETRPEFYDFDLFRATEQAGGWADRRLDQLAYTVFDTETTGLDPSLGDEIISIGAVRIVNGRLLRLETFEQLIDPRRPVSAASLEIHGISPDMLAGQPAIEEVLPLFARFAEDTVLVGHNVAFDLRFLELKEAQAGVRLDQPALDTLLLSAVVHHEHEDHSLEAMAGRLGVSVIGRHTALGDAILTGEIFLKLLALLEAEGIQTLGEAREAAQRTYQARVSQTLYRAG